MRRRRLVDGVQEAYLGASGGGGATHDDADARAYASAAGRVQGQKAREAARADGGPDKGDIHAEPRGVRDEARVLEALVELFEVPL